MPFLAVVDVVSSLSQCAKIVDTFGYVHFSAGDLLRQFVRSGTPEGNKIADMMNNGQIVPSEVIVNLLKTAMVESGKTKFLIDGFPRNLENRDTYVNLLSSDDDLSLRRPCQGLALSSPPRSSPFSEERPERRRKKRSNDG